MNLLKILTNCSNSILGKEESLLQITENIRNFVLK